MKTNKRGISLIVLVITIIVMIILAAAIILSLNSGGIIGKANKGKSDSDRASLKEAATLEYGEYELKTKTGELDASTKTADAYVKEELEGKFTERQLALLEVTDEGKVKIYTEAVVPKGFVASIYPGETEEWSGLVIYETDSLTGIDQEIAMKSYNQYVWIPVPDMNEFVIFDWKEQKQLGNVGAVYSLYTEPSSYGGSTKYQYATEAKEYTEMKESVQKHGGFYIARYEAGTTVERTDKENATTVDSNNKQIVLSQKDKFVYDYVAWGTSMTDVTGDISDSSDRNQGMGAVELSKSIYPESANKNLVSTLCYGTQWDAVMRFMNDVENPTIEGAKYITNSKNMGWYYSNSGRQVHKTGEDIEIDVNSDGEVDLTGTNRVKNIYDMAGNAAEWTMEAYSTNKRVQRGGYFGISNSAIMMTSYRSAISPEKTGDPTYLDKHGFRVALYLK